MQISLRPTKVARRAMAVLAAAAALGAGTAFAGVRATPAAATPSISLHVAGNQLVDAAGNAVQLVGVNRSGTEYACVQGWGIFDGPSDAKSISAMASWHVNAVRIPLNEDCWLGINGVEPAYSGNNYRSAIAAYVAGLNSAGIVAILDLHWGAPGSTLATSQEQMPDSDHAPAFWKSVASAFKSNPDVIFDLFNEPHNVSWSCWLSGCTLADGTSVAGMQTLLNVVRSTGATQAVMVEGLAWGGDLSGFLANEPIDPDHNLVASAHLYNFSGCNTSTCWNSTIAPVAAAVPVVTGEIGETDCSATWINSYMPWADSHGISYLAWAWDAGGGWSCSNGPSLIDDYSGTPNAFGAGFESHLMARTATPTTTATATAPLTTTTLAPTTTTTTPAATTTTTQQPAQEASAGTSTAVQATLTQNWGSGGVVDLRVTNTGTNPLGSSEQPWIIRFSLPLGATISSMWNASMSTQSGGQVAATAPSYTQSLAPGTSMDIGYVEQGSTGLPISVSLTAPPAGGSSDAVLSSTFEQTAAWGNGANGAITVANTGSAASKPWSLSFTLPPGTAVTAVWCATLVSQSSGTVTLSGPSWNPTLPADGSDTVGWTQSGSTAGPGAVRISG